MPFHSLPGTSRLLRQHLIALAITVTLAPSLARAGEPTDAALLARIAALEQRLGIASGESIGEASLDQHLRIIERKLELQDEAAQAKAASAPVLAASEKGVSVKSADGAVEIRFRGLVQADARSFISGSAQNDGFLLRRLEPSIEGNWGTWVGFRINPQFAGDSATLNEAYVDLKFDPRATVRIGKAKPPFGLERLQSSATTAQVELGLPSELAPGRDIGMQLQGSVLGGVLDYGIGAFNGTVDGRDAVTGNPDGEFEYAGRLFWEPFKHAPGDWGSLGLGVAATVGNTHGNGSNFLPRYRTPGQEQFFGYGSNVAADGQRLRKNVQGYWYRGSLGLLGEWISSAQAVRVISGAGAGSRVTLDNRGWQIAAGWVLTGEDAGYRGVVKPESPFAIGQPGWGALEATLRYGRLQVDEAAFPYFADAAASAQAARSWGVAIHWYLTRNAKLMTNYVMTKFDGGALAGGNRPQERVLFTRAQLSF